MRSEDRILTTHVGSLPRPSELVGFILDINDGKPYDAAAFEATLHGSVMQVVRQQADIGIDIVADGEFGKPSFINYINDRLDGFVLDPTNKSLPWARSREVNAFPEFYASPAAQVAGGGRHVYPHRMACVGPIKYKDQDIVRKEIKLLDAALKQVKVAGAFVPAISTTYVETWQRNDFYKSHRDYLYSIADALHEEYRLIADSGHQVQVDDPPLLTHYQYHPDESIEDCRKWAEERVEVLNHALRGIPPERVRYHTCFSINVGPRVHDMEFKDIVDIMLKINAGAYSFEAANPRHDHEWELWESVKLPEGKVLIPGVITHSTVLVEHPSLVAQRIVRFANLVGRENVIAGADCGFSSVASETPEIPNSVIWAKLQSLVEGARIASRELWSRSRPRALAPHAGARRGRFRVKTH